MKLLVAVLVSLALAGTAVAATQPAPYKAAIKVKVTPGLSMF